jgi:hypothetical protein
MLIQALGRRCVVNNARLLLLLDNPAHIQGSPCLLGRRGTATQGPRDQGHKLRLKMTTHLFK